MKTFEVHIIVKNGGVQFQKLCKRLLAGQRGDIFVRLFVCDTGSTDGTVQFLESFRDYDEQKGALHFFCDEWKNDFAYTRNRLVEFANGRSYEADYVMWLDADDMVSRSFFADFCEEAASRDADWYSIPYWYVCREEQNVTVPVVTQIRERAYKKGVHATWKREIHEVLEFSSPDQTPLTSAVLYFPVVLHKKGASDSAERNFRILNAKADRTPADVFYLTREAGAIGEHAYAIEVAATYNSDSIPWPLIHAGHIAASYNALKERNLADDCLQDKVFNLLYKLCAAGQTPDMCNVVRCTDSLGAVAQAVSGNRAWADALISRLAHTLDYVVGDPSCLYVDLDALKDKVEASVDLEGHDLSVKHCGYLYFVLARLLLDVYGAATFKQKAELVQLLSMGLSFARNVSADMAELILRVRKLLQSTGDSICAVASPASVVQARLVPPGSVPIWVPTDGGAYFADHFVKVLHQNTAKHTRFHLGRGLEPPPLKSSVCYIDESASEAQCSLILEQLIYDEVLDKNGNLPAKSSFAESWITESSGAFPTGKQIVFLASGADNWDGNTMWARGIGASETGLVLLAESLVQRGHDVVVFNTTKTTKKYNGVRYEPLHTASFADFSKVNAVIVSRSPELLDLCRNYKGPAVLWLHDLPGEYVTGWKNLHKYAHIVCVSEFQMDAYIQALAPKYRASVCDKDWLMSVLRVIHSGLPASVNVQDVPVPGLEEIFGEGLSAIWFSSPERGIYEAYEWAKRNGIRRLLACYGNGIRWRLGLEAGNPEMLAYTLSRMVSQAYEGVQVFKLGIVPLSVVRALLRGIPGIVWRYGTNFEETQCMAFAEAFAAHNVEISVETANSGLAEMAEKAGLSPRRLTNGRLEYSSKGCRKSLEDIGLGLTEMTDRFENLLNLGVV